MLTVIARHCKCGWREGEREAREGKGGRKREGGKEEGRVGILLCDGNCGVGAYGIKWVYNKEPERRNI